VKKRNWFRVFGSFLLVVPLTALNAQQVAQPGSFDPQSARAHADADQPQATHNLEATPQGVGVPLAKQGRVIIPTSSVVNAADAGVRAHTNHLVFLPQGLPSAAGTANLGAASPLAAAASAQPFYTFAENPGSLGCVYQISTIYAGCTPSGGYGFHPVGGSGAIAIVDAFHNPNAAADLNAFDAQWGLPAANFTQIYCQPSGGTCYTTNPPPATDKNWGLEEALDIEWAHAMAPNAKIFLIEAASNSLADLTWANAWAGYYVDINGGGTVSNSWGSGEFAGETAYDPFFNNYYGNFHPVVYLASSGDSGVVEYPSASPYVVSAGGTTVNRDSSGNFVSQSCWAGTGRGASTVETIPTFQGTVGGLGGNRRITTDLSFDADPASGAWVYDQLNGGWFVVGGTSLAAPALAGVINNAGNKLATSLQENNLLYSEYVGGVTHSAFFLDVAPAGYDACTGIGTPRTLVGK
jgi:kumamolisin